MTFADRVAAVEALGVTPRQARFLTLVALHSGYCLRRQYAASAGIRHGKNVCAFLDGLVTRDLARRFAIRADRGHLYHLHARRLYRLVGDEGSWHRREVSAARIARRLMRLDFVLAHPDVDWVATPTEQTALLDQHVAALPPTAAPSETPVASSADPTATFRHGGDRSPIALVGTPPVLWFACLVTDLAGHDLERFLRDHAALLHRLPAWCVVAVATATTHRHVDCASIFARAQSVLGGQLPDDPVVLRRHFRARQALDRGQVARWSAADIERFRRQRETYAAPLFTALYQTWLERGDAVLGVGEAPRETPQPTRGRLVIETLPFDYSQFGSLPGVA